MASVGEFLGSLPGGEPCGENVSRVNLSQYWEEDVFANPGAATAFVILFVIGVPLNIYILAVLIYKKLYQQPTFLLLLNLTISDLLLCLFPLLFNIITALNMQGSFGNTDYVRCNVCKIGVTFVIFNTSIYFTLLFLSIERLIFFKSPIEYDKFVTTQRIVIALVAEWLISIAIAIPTLVGYGDFLYSQVCGHVYITQYHIERGFVYGVVSGLIIISIVLVVIVCNLWMVILAVKVYTKKRKIKVDPGPCVSDCPDETGLKRRVPTLKRKKKFRRNMEVARRQCAFVRTFGAILVTNCASIIPVIVLGVMIFTVDISYGFAVFVQVAIYSQTTAHPIVEVLFAPELRKILLQSTRLKNSKFGKCVMSNCEDCCSGDFMIRELASRLSKVPVTSSSHGGAPSSE